MPALRAPCPRNGLLVAGLVVAGERGLEKNEDYRIVLFPARKIADQPRLAGVDCGGGREGADIARSLGAFGGTPYVNCAVTSMVYPSGPSIGSASNGTLESRSVVVPVPSRPRDSPRFFSGCPRPDCTRTRCPLRVCTEGAASSWINSEPQQSARSFFRASVASRLRVQLVQARANAVVLGIRRIQHEH